MTLGIDFGGSSSKATLLGADGCIYATAKTEYPSSSLHSGWLEQEIDDLAEALYKNIEKCIQMAQIDSADIKAIAIDAATHMAVFCDENDKPLRPMIHWSDSRSSVEAEELKNNHQKILDKYCVNAAGSSWTLPQILWLNKHEPQIIAKTHRMYLAKDYLRHLLTDDFHTDYIDIIGTLLADDRTGEWSEELCTLAGLKMEMLPPVCNPGDIAGNVTKEAAQRTGLKEGTPVIIGTTDTVLEILSTGAIFEGDATIKLATAGRICPITTNYVEHPQFYNYKHLIEGLWYPGTATRSCAASYSWFKNTFCKGEELVAKANGESVYELLNREAEETEPGADGLMFHPYLLGEMSPYADDKLCASFVGMRMHHTKGHFARAVMEGVAYSMRDCLEIIREQGIGINSFYAIGGGVKGKLWSQILSDVLQQPLMCIKEADSSLGSAMLAAVNVGLFDSFEACLEVCQTTVEEIIPNQKNKEIYDKEFMLYKEYQKALQNIYYKR